MVAASFLWCRRPAAKQTPGALVGVSIETSCVTLRFGGTAGWYPYAFGMLAAVQDELNVDRIRLHTVSGSGFAAFVLLLNLPMQQVFLLWEQRKTAFWAKHGFIAGLASGKFYQLVYSHCMSLGNLMGDAPPRSPWDIFRGGGGQPKTTASPRLARVTCRNVISVVLKSMPRDVDRAGADGGMRSKAAFKERSRIDVTCFGTMEEWAAALSASAAFVPVPGPNCSFAVGGYAYAGTNAGVQVPTGATYLDGSHPSCTDGPVSDVLAIPLPGSRCERWARGAALKEAVGGLLYDRSEMTLYREGYRDAMATLIPMCRATTGRPCAGQLRSTDHSAAVASLGVNFDFARKCFPPPLWSALVKNEPRA